MGVKDSIVRVRVGVGVRVRVRAGRSGPGPGHVHRAQRPSGPEESFDFVNVFGGS